MSPWTEENVAILRSYWAAKAPARVVAKRLDTTRNAVLGKVYRLHLVHGSDAPDVPPASSLPDTSVAVQKLKSEGHRIKQRKNEIYVDGRGLTARQTIQMAAAYSAPAPRHLASLIVRPLPPPDSDLVCTINGCRGPAQRGRGLCAEHITAAIREESAARMGAAK